MNIDKMTEHIDDKLNEKIIITPIMIHEYIDKCFAKLTLKKIEKDDLIKEIIERLPKTEILYVEFLDFIANHSASKTSFHPEYNKLASYVCTDKLHYLTYENMEDVVELLYNNFDKQKNHSPIVSKELYEIVNKHKNIINEILDFNRDYDIDFFGMKTLERSYLLKIHKNNKKIIIERPQHLFMRVALGIHGENLKFVEETYYYMSNRYFTHATPTLFNAGTNHTQCSSCFLLGVDDDMDNILTQIKQTGMISKWSGGIGIHLTSIRGKNSIIRGTNGLSDGIIPLCNVINKLSRYINQGGKRGGAIAIYLEPWHSDIFEFCELRKQNTGHEDNRTRDLFIALWICDLFMKRVENDEMWSLMCPDECPNLNKTFGEEFEKLYLQYEQEQRYKKQVKARDLWMHILECQLDSGLPYIAYKDHVNKKSNQQNVGTICSSNLCIEVMEYSDANETAVCNLASLCLPRYIENNVFNYNKLQYVVKVCVRNLNKIIDVNFYPSKNAEKSNKRHRPMGIGVQGLADVYNILGLPFESEEASYINKKIFETIYFSAMEETCKLAKENEPYETFKGSPFSQGKLQFHLWNMDIKDLITKDLYDWNKLISDVKQYGTRNSLLTALMPTASTSQIMKCSECFEPYMANVFTRMTLAGEFVVINENLIKDLEKYNLWNKDMREEILQEKGSIQKILKIPANIREIYKTAYEIKLKNIISQSADRAPFIDQSQSMNLFLSEQDPIKLMSAHFYSWKRGLKTGMYYLRTTPASDPLKFGLKIKKNVIESEKEEKMQECRKIKGCLSCGS